MTFFDFEGVDQIKKGIQTIGEEIVALMNCEGGLIMYKYDWVYLCLVSV